MLVQSLLPVGILNLLSLIQLFVSLALKSPSREWSIKSVCMYDLPPNENVCGFIVGEDEYFGFHAAVSPWGVLCVCQT